jgi:ketosteroid isomerase-like protein
MSVDIAEIARIWNQAFRARRVPVEILASDFVMENATTAVTTQNYVGATGIEQWFDDFFGVLAEGSSYNAEVIALGEDCAVGRIILTGRGRMSGAPLDLSHWGVVWIRGGKVARAVGFETKREALKAAGLENQRLDE